MPTSRWSSFVRGSNYLVNDPESRYRFFQEQKALQASGNRSRKRSATQKINRIESRIGALRELEDYCIRHGVEQHKVEEIRAKIDRLNGRLERLQREIKCDVTGLKEEKQVVLIKRGDSRYRPILSGKRRKKQKKRR